MEGKYPLNVIKVSQRYSNGRPAFVFEYTNPKGGTTRLFEGRLFSKEGVAPEVEEFMAAQKLKVDLSGITTKREAENFRKEYMARYSEPESLYKNIYQYERKLAEKKEAYNLMSVFHDCVLASLQECKHLSPEEKSKAFSFLVDALKARGEGKSLDAVQLPRESFASQIGIKRDGLFYAANEMKKRINKISPADVSDRTFSAVSTLLSKGTSVSMEEAKKVFNVLRNKYASKAVEESAVALELAKDLLTVATKEVVEGRLDKQIEGHLAKGRIDRLRQAANHSSGEKNGKNRLTQTLPVSGEKNGKNRLTQTLPGRPVREI